MSDYGDQIIIKRVKKTSDKSPVMRAEIVIDGVKRKASLWVWTRKDGSPVLDKDGEKQWKGKPEIDNYKGGGQQQRQPAPATTTAGMDNGPGDDGSIPF